MASRFPSLVEIYQLSISGDEQIRWNRVRQAINSLIYALIEGIQPTKAVEAVDICYPNISRHDWEIVMFHAGFLNYSDWEDWRS